MDTLQRGQIAVRKKYLLDLISIIQLVENNIDVIMKEKESFERGRKIAKELNRLTFQRHAFQHFQLNIPLKKLK